MPAACNQYRLELLSTMVPVMSFLAIWTLCLPITRSINGGPISLLVAAACSINAVWNDRAFRLRQYWLVAAHAWDLWAQCPDQISRHPLCRLVGDGLHPVVLSSIMVIVRSENCRPSSWSLDSGSAVVCVLLYRQFGITATNALTHAKSDTPDALQRC